MRHARLLFLSAMLVSASVLVGCGEQPNPGGSQTPAAASPKKLRIAVIPKGTSHEFWKSVHAGAQQAASELSNAESGQVEIIWQGPASESDINGQIAKVRALIVSHVDGIVLAPNHSKSLVKVVQEANQQKIPVVIFDSA